ncbi:MAG: sigma-70 family RNA polymerase sigma factor [Gemmataceae bacterium]|nr:sigma-70 family RNA polymerase sigma factor [Gemmataceae bacterium]
MAQVLAKAMLRLRGLAVRANRAAATDRELLTAFAAAGDEVAFEQLVRRHGDMVRGVCRRVLGNAADADDAFQATFLVLARKAGQGGWHDSVRNWLYGVAYRVAVRARRTHQRRRRRESQAVSRAAVLDAAWNELSGVLDEELQQLPAKYRAPLLLCYFDGKTREEAAAELGWSLGSVKGRLERGRELLRERLRRRGLTLPAALCAGLLTDGAAEASLVEATTRAAVSFAAGHVAAAASRLSVQLAQGVLQAMLIAKCKIAGLILTLTCVVGLGGTVAVHQAWAGRGTPAPAVPLAAADLDFAVFEPPPDTVLDTAQDRDGEQRRPQDPGQGERREKETTVRGAFKSHDARENTITIRLARDNERGEATFMLDGKNVKIMSSSPRPLTVADLKEGMIVHLVLNEKEAVTAIRLERPTQNAQLVSVDAAKKTITIRSERAGEATLKVADDAKIFHGDKAIGLGELKGGQPVALQLSEDRQWVLAIRSGIRELGRPRGEGDGRRRERDTRLNGVIVELDVGKGTVGILVGRDGDFHIKTLTLAKDSKIRLLHGDQPLAELNPAQLTKAVQVFAAVDDDAKVASALDVIAPKVRGRVKEVDASARKIVVAGERQEQTFEVAADAKVLRGRNEVRLSELRPGVAVALALSLDRSRVLAVTMLPGDGERERE